VAPSRQISSSFAPPSPSIVSGARNPVVSKPVPKTIVSAGRATPSVVTTASRVTRSIGSLTTSTLGRTSAW
jgi:hypothetical protein